MFPAMAPPLKRRKLSDAHSHHHLNAEEHGLAAMSPKALPAPFAHAVESLDMSVSAALPSPSPPHTESDPLAPSDYDSPESLHSALKARDALALGLADDLISGLESTLTSVLNSIASPTITADAASVLESAASALADTSNSSSTAASASSTSSISAPSSTSGTSGISASSTHPVASSSTFASNSSAVAGTGLVNATSSSSPSGTGYFGTGTRTALTYASQSTLWPNANATAPYLYTVTLLNGTAETVTESRYPYTTTFDDAEVFTIPGYLGSIRPTASSDFSSATGDISAAGFTTGSSAFTAALATPTTNAASGAGAGTSPTESSGPASTSISPPTENSPAPIAPPATIAGGVVGGAAGLAVIVFIAMLFLRWYRTKAAGAHHQLPSATRNNGMLDDHDGRSRGAPGMAERAGLMPLVAAVPALFRHAHQGGQNRSLDDVSTPSERGFTRVSGRKLPSQFSPGMSSSDPLPSSDYLLPTASAAGLGSSYRATSASSPSLASDSAAGSPQASHNLLPRRTPRNPFDDRDSHGFKYFDDSEHASSSAATAAGALISPEKMVVSQGPRRQPTVHRPGPYNMTPQGSEAQIANISIDDDAPGVPSISRKDYAPGAGLGLDLVSGSPTPSANPSTHLLSRGSVASSRYTDDMSTERNSVTPSLGAFTSSSADLSGSARNSRFTEEM